MWLLVSPDKKKRKITKIITCLLLPQAHYQEARAEAKEAELELVL